MGTYNYFLSIVRCRSCGQRMLMEYDKGCMTAESIPLSSCTALLAEESRAEILTYRMSRGE